MVVIKGIKANTKSNWKKIRGVDDYIFYILSVKYQIANLKTIDHHHHHHHHH